MNTNEIRMIMDEQKSSKIELSKALKELKANQDYSKEYKLKRANELESKYEVESKARGVKVSKELESYKKSIIKPIDLNDQALSNFLTAVNTLGADTPIQLINDTTEHFRNNNVALGTIRDIAKKNGLNYSSIENYIIDTEMLDSAIIEASMNFANASPVGAIGCTLMQIDDVEGFSYETEAVSSSSAPLII